MGEITPAPPDSGLIFGRDPVLLVNAVQALLVVLLGFGALAFIGIDDVGEVGLVMACFIGVTDLYVSWRTRDTLLSALSGLIKAGIALAAAYGYEVSPENLAAILAAVSGVFAFWQRTQTGPAEVPSLDLTQHTVVVGGEYRDSKAIASFTSGLVRPKEPPTDPSIPPPR